MNFDQMFANVDWQKVAEVLIAKNPNIANNPRAKYALEVIKSGNQEAGEELARNLCSTYGSTQEEGVNLAVQWIQSLIGGGNSQ